MWTFLIKFGKILIEKGSNIMNNKKYIIISVIVGIVFLAMGVLIGLVYSNRDVIFKENNISNENNMPKNKDAVNISLLLRTFFSSDPRIVLNNTDPPIPASNPKP